MKLLICVSEYPPDYSAGIGNVAYNVVDRLKKMGVDCTVCSPNGDIKLGSSRMIERYGIIGLLYYWHQVSNYFKKNDFDAIWLHNPLLLKNPFKNCLVTMHSTYCGCSNRLKPRIYYKISSIIEKYCLNKIDGKTRFTVVSDQVCKELEKIGIKRKRITNIPNGVNTEQFKPADNKKIIRKKFGIPEDDLIILSLGRLTDAKQPQKLIEVFSVIETEMEHVTLIIAGNGELLDETMKFIKEKKLEKIRFLGYVDNNKIAPHLYACSDYYIMTSKYEGQPLTLFEAMASGLPCIVSDIPNLRIVRDIGCGIVVNFNDTEKAAQEILNYIANNNNSEHAKNARKYSIENLDWNIIARKYFEEFEMLYKLA